MKKRMFQMLTAVLAIVAILGFIKFQQIQVAITAGKSFSMPPTAVTSIVARQDEWQGTLEAVGSVEPAGFRPYEQPPNSAMATTTRSRLGRTPRITAS